MVASLTKPRRDGINLVLSRITKNPPIFGGTESLGSQAIGWPGVRETLYLLRANTAGSSPKPNEEQEAFDTRILKAPSLQQQHKEDINAIRRSSAGCWSKSVPIQIGHDEGYSNDFGGNK